MKATPATLIVLLALLALTPGRASAAALCGDINESGTLSSSDALGVLRKAVGQPVTLTCQDNIDRYGEPDDFHTSSINAKDFLLGQKIEIERAATVTHFGFIARTDGTQVRFALYEDDNGEPGAIVTSTPSTAVLLGRQEIASTEVTVSAGTYWLMGNFSDATTIAANEDALPGNIIKYRALPFAQGLPPTFGAPLTYDETRLNYWVKVRQ